MSKLNVFIKDTFIKNVKSFGFLAMLLMPLIVVGIIVVIIYFAGNSFTEMDDVTIAVIGEDPSIVAVLDEVDETINILDDVNSEEEAQGLLGDEEIDGYLIADWEGDTLSASLTHTGDLDMHSQLIEQVLTNLQMVSRSQALGVSPEDAQTLNEPVLLESHIVSIDAGEIVEEDDLANVVALGGAYFINIMIMLFIMVYATTVIEEIAGEKGTRMMEVILSSTTATTHFFGKLIGVFLVMVVHVLFYVLVGLGVYTYFKDHDLVTQILSEVDVGGVLLNFLEYTWVFLLLGVLMYMFIAAFLGSLITKTEDINRAASPLSMLVLLGFYIGLFAMSSPENIVVVISSFIPFLTPFVMPFRLATNTVSSLHVWLSVGGSVLFTGFIALISLMFYRGNVLIYSDTSLMKTIKQSWKLVRSERSNN